MTLPETEPRRRSARRFIVFLLALALPFVASPATSQTKDKITIAYIAVDSTAAVLYANDLGFFDKAELDVTLMPLPNGGAIAAAVASGQVDFGVGNVIAIETAHSNNVPLTLVAPGASNVNGAPSNVVIVAKNSQLQKASDLNGKIVASSTVRGIQDLILRAWMDKNGGDSSTVKFIEIPVPQAEVVVAQGRADAALTVEPFITQARADTRVFANPFEVLGDNYLITAYFALTPWALAHAGQVARFASAIRAAGDWANKNQSRSASILAKYAKLDPDVVNRTVRSHYSLTLTPAQLQPTIDTAARYKFIDHSFPAQDLIY
jgi:NitT/TauT family transport system substrate-binding protein